MRLMIAVFALAVLTTGIAPASAPVAAQDYLGAHLQAQRHDNLRRHQQRIAKKRQQQRRAEASLSPHQRACAKRYRSYNARTDRYTIRPGVTARCRL